MEDRQRITLQLGAHTITLQVPRSQEADYRTAAAMLNRRYQFYASRVHSASAELLWVYVALEAATNLQSDVREKSLAPVEKKLSEINELLRQTLAATPLSREESKRKPQQATEDKTNNTTN